MPLQHPHSGTRLIGLSGSLAAACTAILASHPVQAQGLSWGVTADTTTRPLWQQPRVSEAAALKPSWQVVNPSDLPQAEPPVPVATAPAQQPSAPAVMGLSRGITVGRLPYPDVALTVPNGFKRDPKTFLSIAIDGTNQVRRRTFTGCRGGSSCPDFEFNAELALLQSGPASLELLYNVANVFTDVNNAAWGSQGLGFRAAVNLSPSIGLAIGGESQLDLDNAYCPVDADCGQLKGRTLYAVASAAFPLSRSATPPVLTVSAGVGNGYYGFNGSGASDQQWGPFGSLAYAFNDRVAIGVEYSGYAISGGLSLRPFKQLPLTASIYATDFLGNVPTYLDAYCRNGDCSARLLGRLTYSF